MIVFLSSTWLQLSWSIPFVSHCPLHPNLLLMFRLLSPFFISCCLLFPFCLQRVFFYPRSSPSFPSRCSTTDPRPSTTRSASWCVRRWACCSPFWCPSWGSSSACAAAATTAAERCTNARGRTRTVGAACWERCSSPPHWSSRECDTHARSHGTAEAEYADIGVFFFFLCVCFGAEVHESRVRGFQHRNYSNGTIYSHVYLNACSCKVALYTHTRAHTHLWSSLHTQTVLDRSAPPSPMLFAIFSKVLLVIVCGSTLHTSILCSL